MPFLCQKLVEFAYRVFIRIINNFWDKPATLIMRSHFLIEIRFHVGKCNIKELVFYQSFSVFFNCYLAALWLLLTTVRGQSY